MPVQLRQLRRIRPELAVAVVVLAVLVRIISWSISSRRDTPTSDSRLPVHCSPIPELSHHHHHQPPHQPQHHYHNHMAMETDAATYGSLHKVRRLNRDDDVVSASGHHLNSLRLAAAEAATTTDQPYSSSLTIDTTHAALVQRKWPIFHRRCPSKRPSRRNSWDIKSISSSMLHHHQHKEEEEEDKNIIITCEFLQQCCPCRTSFSTTTDTRGGTETTKSFLQARFVAHDDCPEIYFQRGEIFTTRVRRMVVLILKSKSSIVLSMIEYNSTGMIPTSFVSTGRRIQNG
jgi:hypothetical protein